MLAVLDDQRPALPRGGRPDHVRSVRRHVIDRLDRDRHRGHGPHLRRHPRRPAPATGRGRMTRSPAGFGCHVANVGVKDDTDDLVVIAADQPGRRPACSPAACSSGRASRSAASTWPTGGPRRSWSCRRTPTWPTVPAGRADADALVAAVADRLGCPPGDVLVASTGVIGRRYPIERILAGIADVPGPAGRDLGRRRGHAGS